MTDPRLLSELTRVKVLFQAHTPAAAMGLPSPVSLPKDER
jgi:hypothetical protein